MRSDAVFALHLQLRSRLLDARDPDEVDVLRRELVLHAAEKLQELARVKHDISVNALFEDFLHHLRTGKEKGGAQTGENESQ